MGGYLSCGVWLRFWVVEMFVGPLMVEFLGGWNGLWAMVRTGFVGYGGWLALASLFLFFLLQFVDLSGQWIVRVVVGGFVPI